MTTTASKKTTTTAKPRAKAKPAAAKTRGRAGAKPKAAAPVHPSRLERAADLQVGAVLTARDTVVDAIEELRVKVGSRAAAEKQLKKLEHRGSVARTKVEREARQTSARIEREIKRNRTRVEREVRTLRKDADKQLRSVRSDVSRQADVVSGRVQDAVAPIVDPIVDQFSKVTA